MATINIKSDYRTAEAVRKAICKNVYRSEDISKLADAKRDIMLKNKDIPDYKADQVMYAMVKGMSRA